MFAHFSIWALDDPHLRDEMTTIHKLLDEQGLQYEMNRMSTAIEADFKQITDVIAACQKQLSNTHKRLLINITIDDDRA